MKLTQPFFRLPLRFDAARLHAEIEALPAGAWARHPTGFQGNSSVRLISPNGGDNDEFYGQMRPTVHLRNCPYIRQVLASFGVVWSRSRLMKLDPHSSVPEHADINYQWFNRVRLHVPIVTRPEVRFHCGGQEVHMAPGEAWLFDNWRRHRVENPTDHTRVHLVADTTGTAAFWDFVARSGAAPADATLEFRPDRDPELLTERVQPRPVMPPSEVELLVSDFRGELVPREESADARARLLRYHGLLQGFCFDWRQLYVLHGENPRARPEYTRLLAAMREAARPLAEGLVMRTNQMEAHMVLEGRLLRHLLHDAPESVAAPASATRARLREPLFIVAAPRSGSTLLFETLAASGELWTVGGEAHWLVERIPALRPGAPGIESNRLLAAHAPADVAERIRNSLRENLRNATGAPPPASAPELRVLEKTPKNALRIPFFTQVFPDARFILLWRDPRENLGSIIDAWQSGKWVTYRSLPGWDGPWSLLLPPGWQAMRGKPLEEIAAWQWDCTNRTMLDDLSSLPRERWTSVSYAELLADPARTIRRLCGFAGIGFDEPLAARVAGPLPMSRYTNTAPAPDKWRRHEAAILRVLPSLEDTRRRLDAL
jgi:hypothetical protein